MTVITGRLKVLAATASIIVLAGIGVPAQAGGVDVSGSVGAAVGGLGGAIGGGGGVSAGASVSANNGDSGGIQGNAGISTRNDTKAWLRLKTGTSNGTKAKASANLTQSKNSLDGNAQATLGGSTRLKAKLGANAPGTNGNSLSSNANIFLGGGQAALKTTAGANAGTGGADGSVSLSAFGGPATLDGKAGGDVGTSAVRGNASLSLGFQNGGSGVGGGNGANNGNNSGSNAGIRREIAGLSASERRQLMRKCPSVLSSPASYSADAVRVCRVVGQLAGR